MKSHSSSWRANIYVCSSQIVCPSFTLKSNTWESESRFYAADLE